MLAFLVLVSKPTLPGSAWAFSCFRSMTKTIQIWGLLENLFSFLMATTNAYYPEKGCVVSCQGMFPASNIQPGSEQLLMPHEESNSGVVVQLYFQLFSLKPPVLWDAVSDSLNKNNSLKFNGLWQVFLCILNLCKLSAFRNPLPMNSTVWSKIPVGVLFLTFDLVVSIVVF